MIRQRQLSSIAGAALAALLFSLGASVCVAHASGARATNHTKRVERKRLARELKRNPKAILKRDFLKKAQAVSLDLPLTVRLNRATDQTPSFVPTDDFLEIAWNDQTAPWPTGFTLLSSPDPSVVGLAHGFRAEANFGADTSGYGQVGIIEITQGQTADVEAVAGVPVDVADLDPACGTAALRIDAVVFGTGNATRGILDLFNGRARGALHLLPTVDSSVQTTCGGPWETANQYVPVVGTDPAVPLTFSGAFRVSPAITADGRMRLGTINVSDVALPQTSSFGLIKMCTVPAGSGCAAKSFPARLKLKALTAEVLVGDVPL